MQVPFSVILCTHNPRPDYIRRTLDALKAQTLPKDQWELLLVDNVSEVTLAGALDISWHPLARHVREGELGITHARLRGIKESKGDLLVFVDDDNLLAPDYLETAAGIARQHPDLGVFGAGNLEPEFEVQPALELVGLLPLLALRTVPSALWSNNPRDFSCMPWGAGLCVASKIADQYLELVKQLDDGVLGERGQQLYRGEDDLFSWASVRGDQAFGVFPELRIIHLISAGRLNRRYLLKLIHDHRFSHGVLGYLLSADEPSGIDLFCIARVLLHGIRNGLFSMQCMWATTLAGKKAKRYIAQRGLRPVELRKPKAAEPRTRDRHRTSQAIQPC